MSLTVSECKRIISNGRKQLTSAEQRIAELENTRATHGTLTAEQVRKCVRVGACDHGLWGALDEDTDWQTIADELNAMLVSGVCKNIAPEYLDFLCSECGFVHYHSDENDSGDGNDWAFCPQCGKAVKR